MSGQSDFGQISLTSMILLSCYAVGGSLFEEKNFHLIHETGFGIILGTVAGGLLNLAYKGSLFIFFFFILSPATVYAGGYNMSKRRFFENFKYIILYGFLGTIATFLTIWYCTWLVNEWGWIRLWNDGSQVKLNTYYIMILSATVSATDSVAALTLINPDKYPKLYSVVFGEGMVNDAVSLVLFAAVGTITDQTGEIRELHWKLIIILVVQFLKGFFGSILVGAVLGLATTLCFKFMRFLTKSCVLETGIILYMAYLSFTLCQLINLSGVNSALVTGIVLSKYNSFNISSLGKLTTSVTLSSIAQFCDSFIYIFMGISVYTLIDTSNRSGTPAFAFSWQLALAIILICFISRLVSILFFSLLTIIIQGKQKWKLSLYEISILWFGGLTRGSIAYALIQDLSPNQGQIISVQVVQSTVLIMCVFTTIVLGAIMPFYVSFHLNRDNPQLKNKTQTTALLQRSNSLQNKRQKSFIELLFKKLDENYFKPFFIYDYSVQKPLIKETKKLLAQSEFEYNNNGPLNSTRIGYRPSVLPRPSVQPRPSAFPRPSVQPRNRPSTQNSMYPRFTFGKQDSVRESQIQRMFLPLLIKSKYQQETVFFDVDPGNQDGSIPVGPEKVFEIQEEDHEEHQDVPNS